MNWPFLVACALAGALAVPLDPVATPLSTALTAGVGWLGLRLWRWSGLPGLVTRQRWPESRAVQPFVWLGLGLGLGLLLLAVIRLGIELRMPSVGARLAAAGALPVWRRILIIYTAAVGEELLFRGLILSAVAGTAARLLRAPGGAPDGRALWAANVVAAAAFAAAHLPSWVAVVGSAHLTLGLAAAVLALNGLPALVLGHIFATRGLLAAILTHAGADCAIQLVGPMTR